jgi:GntR family transcriptional regulator/MocR family aminotransferase
MMIIGLIKRASLIYSDGPISFATNEQIIMEITDLNYMVFDRNFNLQKQLYQQLVNKIVKGELSAGMKLPASRRLARELGISRNTVVKAIEQLCDEGFLQSRLGSGVYVNANMHKESLKSSLSTSMPKFELPKLSRHAQSLSCKPDLAEHNLPFMLGLVAVDEFPISIWQKLLRRHSDRRVLCGYNGAQGYLPLRQVLAEYLAHSRGVMCDAEQIIITQGAQQAISICAQVLLNKNDQVIIEDPGYGEAKDAFSAYQTKILTVPLTNESIDVNALNSSAYEQAKLLYCTPTHQYPLGGILPAYERLALLEWAVKHKTWIIEDDYDSEFHFNQKPIAAIQGLAEDTPVIYMGSFSKTIFPALRLGYLVVPKAIVDPFVQIKSAMSGESPLLFQATVTDFISEGHFARHLRRMRQSYHQKWLHFTELLQQLPPKCQIVAQSAGMHLVLKIPLIDDVKLKKHLLKHNFASSALSSYYLSAEKETGLVLGFANTNSEQRITIVQVIKQFLVE